MATKRKGCGFLVTAFVLLVVGAVICGIGIKGAIGSFEPIASFETPAHEKVTVDGDGAITVWLHGSDTTVSGSVSINVKNTATGKFIDAPVSRANTTMSSGNDRKLLIGAFEAKKGVEYDVYVTGLSAGRKISLSNTSVAGMFGSIGMAIVGPLLCGVVALVFGIIGMVKFFGGNKPQPAPAAPGPPPVA